MDQNIGQTIIIIPLLNENIVLYFSGRLVVVGSFVDSVTGEVRQLVMPLLGKLVNFYDQFLSK